MLAFQCDTCQCEYRICGRIFWECGRYSFGIMRNIFFILSALGVAMGVYIDKPRPTTFGRLHTPRGSNVFFREWAPEDPKGKERATVFLQHGGIFHGGYFGEVAEALNKKGIRVLAMDLAGHGWSDNGGGPRGAADSFSRHSDDLGYFVHTMSSPLKSPVFVLGESLGAAVILEGLRTGILDGNQLSGVILSGSAHRLDPRILPSKPVMAALSLLSRVLPNSVRVPDAGVIKGYDDAFGDQEFAVRSRTTDDKLVFEMPPVRYGMQMMRIFKRISRQLGRISFPPLLILHGENDVRCEIEGSREMFAKAKQVDKELKIYEGMKHQLFQDKPELTGLVIDEMVDWVDKKIAEF
ncbi:hypothetical protein AAMO2058_001749300 [Amorphochlora amoebiformis]